MIRGIAIAILVFFMSTSLMGFSLYMDLKPAQAIIFVPTIDVSNPGGAPKMLLEKTWDFVKGIAMAFVITFAAKMAVKLLKELEKFHIIKDIMGYSDALGYYEHIPKLFNKIIDKPRKPGDLSDPKLQKDLGQLAEEANKLPLNSLSRGQITALGLANAPYSVASVSFWANSTSIKKGESTRVLWEVEGENIFIKVNDKQVDLIGSTIERLEQSKYFTLTIWNAANGQPTGYPVTPIEVKVNDQKAPEPNPVPPAPTAKKGLTEEQEKKILKGGLSLLTSQIACGGTNVQAIKNIALYQATKYRGLDPRNIDPRQGNFYTGMLKYGDPFSNPYFQELTLRDMAATLEAKARLTTQTELTSNGLKSLRAENNQISRTSQTIADSIGAAAGSALQSVVKAGDAGFAAKAIGGTLANIVTAALFEQKGKVLRENPFCGIATIAAAEFVGGDLGLGNGNVGNATSSPFANAFIHASPSEINPGDTVLVEWDSGNGDGEAFINGLPTIHKGNFNEVVNQEKEWVLTFKDKTLGDVEIGRARVTLRPPDLTVTPPPPQEVFEFRTNRPLVKGDGIDGAILSWEASGFQNLHTITIRQDDGTTSRDLGTFANASTGSMDVKPTQKTTYKATIQNTNGDTLGQKQVVIDVQQAAKSDYISAPFNVKPRE